MKRILYLIVFVAINVAAEPISERGPLAVESLSGAHFKFSGFIGNRIDANLENWLLRAPQANPGMLEMFRVRDRQPVPQLVPWAGEFVGKYLVSAILALRTTDDPRLSQQISNVVAAFIATQAEDGYLGPFPKEVRLLKNWDLWGHYHAICALTLWYQQSGDAHALAAARKAADLVCRTYLDSGRRVYDAGDAEMNMSILTGVALLYRLTGEPRYLQMAREVERDWERAGDYVRVGLDGREYFQGPRPRWESLHDLQGLLELWRITGETKYRDAFIHHWRSIRRWDRRNTGAFSSGEQATGNPFAPTAIETCCTVAWTALTLDYLRLTGDPEAADALELGTLNGGLGAQHPSGRWWTYNTPMDGTREASAHSIVFQARAGTPELNCCSVNGPRILGLLSEWTVMAGQGKLWLNSYLPGTMALVLNGQQIQLTLDRDYPVADSQRIRVTAGGSKEWTLRLRIPGWSKRTSLQANFEGAPSQLNAGTYVDIRRRWKTGDEVALKFDFHLRAVAGANEAAGRVSLYRGPLLLAYDQAFNSFDEEHISPVRLAELPQAREVPAPTDTPPHEPSAWVQMELSTAGSGHLRLIDFASAGSAGTRFRSWLPVAAVLPPPALTQYPRDGERVPPGEIPFTWRGLRRKDDVSFRLEVASDPQFEAVLLRSSVSGGSRTAVKVEDTGVAPSPNRWWRVVTINSAGETVPDVPAARFVLAKDAPPPQRAPELKTGPDGELIVHSLADGERPAFGEIVSQKGTVLAREGVRVNGQNEIVRYAVPVWPEDDFTVAVRERIDEMPVGRVGQVFSAWAGSMDDPLRLVVDSGKVFARIEAGSGFGTPGSPVGQGRWYFLAAVKRGPKLELYVDGKLAGTGSAPEFIATSARDCALGGNPHYEGNEFLAATFAGFRLWARALSAEEIGSLAATWVQQRPLNR
jgi:uncharacterized protein